MNKELDFSGEVSGVVEPNQLLSVYSNLIELFDNNQFVPYSLVEEFEKLVETKTGKTIHLILEEEVG